MKFIVQMEYTPGPLHRRRCFGEALYKPVRAGLELILNRHRPSNTCAFKLENEREGLC